MRDHEAPESKVLEAAWKVQGEQSRNLQVAMTPDQLCAMVRSRERLRARIGAISLVSIVAIAVGLLYNVYRVDQPWIRIGEAWTLCIVVYLFGPTFENTVRQADVGEPCARFLEREHQERGRHYLRIRNRLFLLVPGILACWRGRAPTIVKGSSASTSAPPWLFLTAAIALVLVRFAFGKAAQKAAHDGDDIRRSAGSLISEPLP